MDCLKSILDLTNLCKSPKLVEAFAMVHAVAEQNCDMRPYTPMLVKDMTFPAAVCIMSRGDFEGNDELTMACCRRVNARLDAVATALEGRELLNIGHTVDVLRTRKD